MLVEFEDVEERQNGVDSSVVIDVDLIIGVIENSSILQQFWVIFARDFIDNLVLLIVCRD